MSFSLSYIFKSRDKNVRTCKNIHDFEDYNYKFSNECVTFTTTIIIKSNNNCYYY